MTDSDISPSPSSIKPITTHTVKSLGALPDRDLDVVVAEVVFGQAPQWRVCDNMGVSKEEALQNAPFAEGTNVVYPCCDHYSTTWGGMGLVVARMRELHIYLGIRCGTHYGYEAYYMRGDQFHMAAQVGAKAMPRAVAIMAILACQDPAAPWNDNFPE